MKKKLIKISVGLIIGLFFIYLWTKFIDVPTVITHFKEIKIKFALLSILFYIIAYFFRSQRWRKLLSTNQKISSLKAFLFWMSGNFLNFLIPIRAGEFLRCYLIKKENGSPISKTLPSVFIDKLFDTIGILIVIFLIPFLSIKISTPLLILIILLFVIFVFGVIILILSALAEKKITKILQKLFFFIPQKKLKDKIHNLVEYFVQGTALFKYHLDILPPTIIFTFLAIIFDTLFFLFIFYAFGQDISFFAVLFGYTLIFLSYVLPQPPAQLGSNELIMVIIFSVGMGFNKELVSAVIAFSHIITTIILVIIGFISLSYSGIKISETLK